MATLAARMHPGDVDPAAFCRFNPRYQLDALSDWTDEDFSGTFIYSTDPIPRTLFPGLPRDAVNALFAELREWGGVIIVDPDSDELGAAFSVAYFRQLGEVRPYIEMTGTIQAVMAVHERAHAIDWNRIRQNLLREPGYTPEHASRMAARILNLPGPNRWTERNAVAAEWAYAARALTNGTFGPALTRSWMPDRPFFMVGEAVYPEMTEAVDAFAQSRWQSSLLSFRLLPSRWGFLRELEAVSVAAMDRLLDAVALVRDQFRGELLSEIERLATLRGAGHREFRRYLLQQVGEIDESRLQDFLMNSWDDFIAERLAEGDDLRFLQLMHARAAVRRRGTRVPGVPGA